MFAVFVLCTFSSAVDLLIGLENDGVIKGYVDFYLKNGEPYLRSAYGIHICYWDGTVHYALYMRMLYALANREDCRSVALFWLGSFINSLIVFLPGNFLGDYPIKWSMMLNIPYIIIAIYGSWRFFPRQSLEGDKSTASNVNQAEQEVSVSKTRRVARLTPAESLLFRSCVVYLISCVALAFLRALAALDCPHSPFSWYAQFVEPQLAALTVAYPRLQMLAYVYYYVPYYCFAMFAFLSDLRPEKLTPTQLVKARSRAELLYDLSLFFAGATAQAQFSHVGSTLHTSTPLVERVPLNAQSRVIFWLINMGLAAGQFIITYCAYLRYAKLRRIKAE